MRLHFWLTRFSVGFALSLKTYTPWDGHRDFGLSLLFPPSCYFMSAVLDNRALVFF